MIKNNFLWCKICSAFIPCEMCCPEMCKGHVECYMINNNNNAYYFINNVYYSGENLVRTNN
jgi:hypothetical protein